MSCSRVLVTEFVEDLIKINDIDALKKEEFSQHSVGKILSRVSASMIMEHGFVHGDPHAGNIYVRRHPQHSKQPQIVVLDHGLYHEASLRQIA